MTNTKTNLMFENTAKIGDRIKAFDFVPQKGRGHSYLEGIVVDKGMLANKNYYSYQIKITKVVKNGKDVTEDADYKYSYVPFETSDDRDDLKYYHALGQMRVSNITERYIKIEYFVWGLVDGEHKSFYVAQDDLDKFMDEQKLSKSTRSQIRNLMFCQGLELDKGFTIERRYTFGNGETSKKFKVQKFRTNLEA